MKTPASKITGWQIVVVDNGFVFVGDCDPHHGDQMMVQHVKQLRKWGTESGLGQLVDGPTRNTVMDAIPVIVVPKSRIVFAIPVNADKWSKL